jgi:hypothetical protein
VVHPETVTQGPEELLVQSDEGNQLHEKIDQASTMNHETEMQYANQPELEAQYQIETQESDEQPTLQSEASTYTAETQICEAQEEDQPMFQLGAPIDNVETLTYEIQEETDQPAVEIQIHEAQEEDRPTFQLEAPIYTGETLRFEIQEETDQPASGTQIHEAQEEAEQPAGEAQMLEDQPLASQPPVRWVPQEPQAEDKESSDEEDDGIVDIRRMSSLLSPLFVAKSKRKPGPRRHSGKRVHGLMTPCGNGKCSQPPRRIRKRTTLADYLAKEFG